MLTTGSPSPASCSDSDEDYARLEAAVAASVAQAAGEPLFTTDAPPGQLWRMYLDPLPDDRRRHYTCHTCRRFVQKYGPLVRLDADGDAAPLLWSGHDGSPLFRASVQRLNELVGSARVNGVFLSADDVWGVPRTGDWSHLSAANPAKYAGVAQSAEQVAAQKREEYGMLCHALADYPPHVVEQALRVLRADALDRSEKALGVAEWFSRLHELRAAARGARRDNLVWRHAATAPPGFCHVRSTMISTLLDDIVAGLPFDDISRRWAKKMHPLLYQRPQAAPAVGAIEQAEKLVERLGVARSLERRFATLDDVLAKLWTPAPAAEPRAAGGVFGALRDDLRRPAVPLELPEKLITWEKFQRDVLPRALTLGVRVPFSGPFYGLVTATHDDAPPILQWDGLAGQPRNPVSWYFYHGGSEATRWGLTGGALVPVTAVFASPPQWQESEKFAHQGKRAFFALLGCRDGVVGSLCLFPETLRSELHGVRSVIEAHSSRGKVTGHEAGSANGIAFQDGAKNFVLAVLVGTAGGSEKWCIDRWE